MPAPPTEIRVKRKATDDPVELLREFYLASCTIKR
jgi:hypothetical protein